MKAVKIIGILLGVWVAIVVIFESLLGYMQTHLSGFGDHYHVRC